jgi:molecular chaperone GrpE (heat shock protein)
LRPGSFAFVGNLDTLLAVVVGALLATVGGLVAEHYEDRIERRRRERDAARFFTEILGSIDALLDRAAASQKIGDPWGPVTLRFFRAAMREAQVYERNRERLFDLQDTELRSTIHAHFVSKTFPLEALIEGSDKINAAAAELDERHDLSAEKRDKLERQLADMKTLRERAAEFVMAERAKAADIAAALSKLAVIPAKRLQVGG